MKVYPTKVDFWLVLLLLGTILFSLVMGILVYPISNVSGFIFFGVMAEAENFRYFFTVCDIGPLTLFAPGGHRVLLFCRQLYGW